MSLWDLLFPHAHNHPLSLELTSVLWKSTPTCETECESHTESITVSYIPFRVASEGVPIATEKAQGGCHQAGRAATLPTCRVTGRTDLIQAKFASIASLFSKLGLLAAVKSIVSITALKLHYSSRITSLLASFKCLLCIHLTQSSPQPREEVEKEQKAQKSCPKQCRAAEEVVLGLEGAHCPHPCPCTAQTGYLGFI